MPVQILRLSKLSGVLGIKWKDHEVENEIKIYILVGYLISSLLTILLVFWAVQRMLIVKSEIYFLVGMTLIASLIGAAVSLFLLSPVFSSLRHLKKQAQNIADKDFSTEIDAKGPIEFQELGQSFNDM